MAHTLSATTQSVHSHELSLVYVVCFTAVFVFCGHLYLCELVIHDYHDSCQKSAGDYHYTLANYLRSQVCSTLPRCV